MEPISEAILEVAKQSVESDTALLKLCNTIIDRFKELEAKVEQLEKRILDLSDRVEVLRDVFYTHISDETAEQFPRTKEGE